MGEIGSAQFSVNLDQSWVGNKKNNDKKQRKDIQRLVTFYIAPFSANLDRAWVGG